MSKLNSATMNPDSEVSADLITGKDLEFRRKQRDKTYFTDERMEHIGSGVGDIVVGTGTAIGGAAVIGVSSGADVVSFGTTIVPSTAAKALGATGIVVGTNKFISGAGKVFNGIYASEVKESLNPIKDGLLKINPTGEARDFYNVLEIATEVGVGQLAPYAIGINKNNITPNSKYYTNLTKEENDFLNEYRGKEIPAKIVSKYSDTDKYEFNNTTNPGPLAKIQGKPINNFYGGMYNDASNEGGIFIRVGNEKNSYGNWYTRISKNSEAQARMDLAIKKWWVDSNGEIKIRGYESDKSILNTVYYIKLPEGIPKYKGPVGYQGGPFLGGLDQEQYFIPNSWKYGEIIGTYPVK